MQGLPGGMAVGQGSATCLLHCKGSVCWGSELAAVEGLYELVMVLLRHTARNTIVGVCKTLGKDLAA